jgi:hypothetical protein
MHVSVISTADFFKEQFLRVFCKVCIWHISYKKSRVKNYFNKIFNPQCGQLLMVGIRGACVLLNALVMHLFHIPHSYHTIPGSCCRSQKALRRIRGKIPYYSLHTNARRLNQTSSHNRNDMAYPSPQCLRRLAAYSFPFWSITLS